MYYDAEKLIKFCSQHGITTEQFLFMHLTYKKQYALLYEYCEKVRLIGGLKELEERGLVQNLNKGAETYPDNYIVIPKMEEEINWLLGDQAEELFRACPSMIPVGDRMLNAQTISPEDLEVLYAKKVKKRKIKHEDVLKALKEQVANGTMGMGLKKWVETEQWNREDNTVNIVAYDI